MDFPTLNSSNVHCGLILNRRMLLLALSVAILPKARANAQQAAPSSEAMLAGGVRVLTHEKSAAEQYAVILGTVGKTNTATYVRGIQLYAEAKADFDALVAELKFDLTTGQDPSHSAVFTGALQGAGRVRLVAEGIGRAVHPPA